MKIKHIKSKVPVEFNTGINQKKTAIVCGIIQNFVYTDQGTGANFVYTEENGQPVHQNAFQLDVEGTNALNEQIKDDIPEGLTHHQEAMYRFYLAYMVQMAETFKIAVSDIEIVFE